MATEHFADRTDEQLVEGILEGREECFNALHARYHQRIYRFAVKRLSDPAEAEDVTQEVFFQIHRCLPSFEGRSSLLTWMFGIAHNQVCRRFRRQRPLTVSIDEPEAAELVSPAVPADRQIDASRVLARCQEVIDEELSDSQREAFHLRYAENQSTRDIARRMGKSNQAVKIGLFRSRRALSERTPDLDMALSA